MNPPIKSLIYRRLAWTLLMWPKVQKAYFQFLSLPVKYKNWAQMLTVSKSLLAQVTSFNFEIRQLVPI